MSRGGRYVALVKSHHNADDDLHVADLTAPGLDQHLKGAGATP